jgi:hypothetical protein
MYNLILVVSLTIKQFTFLKHYDEVPVSFFSMSPYIHSCSHLHANQARRKEAADKYSEDRRVESQMEPNDNSRRRKN